MTGVHHPGEFTPMSLLKSRMMKEVDITNPVAGRVVIKNSYWCCMAGDPKRALFYGTSPQCNQNELIVKMNKDKIFNGENVEVVFVETAFALPRS